MILLMAGALSLAPAMASGQRPVIVPSAVFVAPKADPGQTTGIRPDATAPVPPARDTWAQHHMPFVYTGMILGAAAAAYWTWQSVKDTGLGVFGGIAIMPFTIGLGGFAGAAVGLGVSFIFYPPGSTGP